MKFLGVDLGAKRTGLAIGLSENRTAAPLRTLESASTEWLASEIAKIAASEGIDEVVLGDPLLKSGERGAASARARSFARELEHHLGPKPVRLIDERLSTRLAERLIKEYGSDRDSLAAAAILQGYLDSNF